MSQLQPGAMRFEFEGSFVDHRVIPADDIIGVTAIMLTCSYNEQEFFRCGYYVNVDYKDEELR